MAAVFMPVMIFITSIAAYTGLVDPGHFWDVMHTVPFRVLLFFLISYLVYAAVFGEPPYLEGPDDVPFLQPQHVYLFYCF